MQFFCIFSQTFTALFVCFGTTIFYSYLSSFCNSFYLIGKILFFFEHISKSSKNNNNTSFITFSRLITLCTHLPGLDENRVIDDFVHDIWICYEVHCTNAPEAFTVGYMSVAMSSENKMKNLR